MPETNLYSVTIPPMIKSLKALSAILDKAAAHADAKKTERHSYEEALLDDRLIFDQFSLVRQVQAACDQAKGGAARLAQIERPVHEDTERTFAALKIRMEQTVAFIESVKPEQVAGKETIHVSLPFFTDKHLTGFGYATEYLLPNFYFHLTMAYAIVRKNGVPLGKSDFISTLPLQDGQ